MTTETTKKQKKIKPSKGFLLEMNRIKKRRGKKARKLLGFFEQAFEVPHG